MRSKLYDIIIIGGGINGAGIARDAAERGLSVFLAEKNDFGFGTTFRSTKLIHGGLRYLEYYEISLVRESLRERETLLKTASHLVKPIKFVLPVYNDNKYGYGKVKLGLLTYDVLSYDKSLENHRSFSTKELLSIEPNIRSRNLKGGFTYCDCQISYPERLCLENILMAKEAGADVCSYTIVTDLLKTNRQIEGVRIHDHRTGGETEVHGRVTVNAAGPWVDEILKLEGPRLQPRLSGTKGSHILLSKFPGGPNNALYVPAHQDGRPFFIIPWRDYYWVGTTDIRYNGSLDDVCPTKDEIDYLIKEVNFFAPTAKLTASDVIYSLAGIRPLPATRNGTEEAEITRRHIIFDHEDEGVDGLISIIGGKLTTYRNLAQETVDYLFKRLEKPAPPCQTSTRPLLGGGMKDIRKYIRENCAKYSSRYGLDAAQIHYLISIYGRKFWRVLSLLEINPKLGERICQHNPDIKAQVVFSIQNELPKSLSDIYLRRTGIGTSACRGLDCAETGAKIMGKNLKWRRKQIKKEVVDYEKSVAALFG
ncbi:glycerol-3-phosphate dehydrogenase [bacterium]|nr:glycerol-3-phosphate dehydrogenase [bacterium]